jgi:hypothetical protein
MSIAVSGRCAARMVRGRVVCGAKSMEEMMEGCQFFRMQGTTCKFLSMGSYRQCRNFLVRDQLGEKE